MVSKHIQEHYTLTQSKHKKIFVTTNQKFRQKATVFRGRDFFKMLNDNFVVQHNNKNNCIIELLYGDLDEISYIKKFASIYNYDTFKHFFSPDVFI